MFLSFYSRFKILETNEQKIVLHQIRWHAQTAFLLSAFVRALTSRWDAGIWKAAAVEKEVTRKLVNENDALCKWSRVHCRTVLTFFEQSLAKPGSATCLSASLIVLLFLIFLMSLRFELENNLQKSNFYILFEYKVIFFFISNY